MQVRGYLVKKELDGDPHVALVSEDSDSTELSAPAKPRQPFRSDVANKKRYIAESMINAST
jgi:hypothetical protein